MSWETKLTRDEIINDIESFKDHKDFIQYRDKHLKLAIEKLDIELIEVLLKAGANPNIEEPWGDDALLFLVYEYKTMKSTRGNDVIQTIDLLLSYGADPNHICTGNWRAIDHCIDSNYPELTELFLKYGADKKQREYM